MGGHIGSQIGGAESIVNPAGTHNPPQTELKSARLIQIMMGGFLQEVWTDRSPSWTFTGVQCLDDRPLPEPTEGTCQLQNFVCGTETK